MPAALALLRRGISEFRADHCPQMAAAVANKVYGSLGAIVAFMFFVYLAAIVFLFGAEIASEYPRLRAQSPA